MLQINRVAFMQGIVVVWCQSCNQKHLIADNLGKVGKMKLNGPGCGDEAMSLGPICSSSMLVLHDVMYCASPIFQLILFRLRVSHHCETPFRASSGSLFHARWSVPLVPYLCLLCERKRWLPQVVRGAAIYEAFINSPESFGRDPCRR